MPTCTARSSKQQTSSLLLLLAVGAYPTASTASSTASGASARAGFTLTAYSKASQCVELVVLGGWAV